MPELNETLLQQRDDESQALIAAQTDEQVINALHEVGRALASVRAALPAAVDADAPPP